jgi:flagellar biosynthesis/type III secretory pathway protein FliH
LKKQKEEAKQKQKEIWREEKKRKIKEAKQEGTEEGLEGLVENAEKRQKLQENFSVSDASNTTENPHKTDSSVKAYYKEFKKVIDREVVYDNLLIFLR